MEPSIKSILLCYLPIFLGIVGYAQSQNLQSDTINNLVLPDGYQTAPSNTLGNFIKKGKGKTTLILIPGLGFDASVFNAFMKKNENDYTIYAVTLPGFGDTKSIPMPIQGTSYGQQVWTTSAVNAVEKLILSENIENPILVGHFVTGTQVAFRLALKNPHLISKLVIIAGPPKLVDLSLEKEPTLQERIEINDNYFAPRWFKTVTKKTWDDGNYPPSFYSKDSLKAAGFWQKSSDVIVPVMVQYLSEFNASDISLDFKELKVPTLVLIPEFTTDVIEKFEGLLTSFQYAWVGVEEVNPLITIKEIPNANIFIFEDNSKGVKKALKHFIK